MPQGLTVETLTAFFGWLTILHMGFLGFTAILLLAFRDRLAGLHAAIMGMEEDSVKKEYFAYMANYKILIFVTALMPYLALKLI
ncbi:DUF6868 family protein [Pseudophaeobacter sp.]|uniref:DUF6868 family protein n=1 Tax=Pseudophaeobacter sp. TaxID=1971739 RepID=UPI003299AF75